MADGYNDEGADGQGPYDPLLLPDGFADVLHLLDIPGGLDLPAAEPVQNVTAGSSGGDILDWPAMLDNSDDGIADRTPNATAADLPSGAQAIDAGASASTSSSAAHENALDCTVCHVLREVVHSNGSEATKLSIHGAAGMFYHATLDVYGINSEGLALALTNRSYIEGRDYVWVKQYLMDYAQQRARCGCAVVQDSISAFHDALCTSMNYGGHADHHREAEAAVGSGGDQQILVGAADAVQHDQQLIEQGDLPAAPGPSEPNDIVVEEQQVVQPAVRSALAIQRERASKLELRDIARYFHVPIATAAKELRICTTVLKSVRRKFGLQRWPYRKIKGIDRQIAELRSSGNGGAAAMNDIERLTESRRNIYAGLR